MLRKDLHMLYITYMPAVTYMALCMCVCYRKEVRALGLTVLVDARRCSPVPALFKAFNILQVRMHAFNYPPGENTSTGIIY